MDSYSEAEVSNKLVQKVLALAQKPTLNTDIRSVLRECLRKLERESVYLENGILNFSFAEMAIVLEQITLIYGKKVDLLWEELFQYQKRLLTLNADQEKARIEQGIMDARRDMFKRKRKKPPEKPIQEQATEQAVQNTPANNVTDSNMVMLDFHTEEELMQAYATQHRIDLEDLTEGELARLRRCVSLLARRKLCTRRSSIHLTRLSEDLVKQHLGRNSHLSRDSGIDDSDASDREDGGAPEGDGAQVQEEHSPERVAVLVVETLREGENPDIGRNIVEENRVDGAVNNVEENRVNVAVNNAEENRVEVGTSDVEKIVADFGSDKSEMNEEAVEGNEEKKYAVLVVDVLWKNEEDKDVDIRGKKEESNDVDVQAKNIEKNSEDVAAVDKSGPICSVDTEGSKMKAGKRTLNKTIERTVKVHKQEKKKLKRRSVREVDNDEEVPKRKRRMPPQRPKKRKPITRSLADYEVFFYENYRTQLGEGKVVITSFIRAAYIAQSRMLIVQNTIRASLAKFEWFYYRNYNPQEGEGVVVQPDFPEDPNNPQPANSDDTDTNDDDDDDEAERISSRGPSANLIRFSSHNDSGIVTDASSDCRLTPFSSGISEGCNDTGEARADEDDDTTTTDDDDENEDEESRAIKAIVKKVLRRRKERQDGMEKYLEWHAEITAKLADTNQQDFDVHEYEGKVLDKLPEKDPVKLRGIMKEQESTEVCRLFVASLQLVNSSNIEVLDVVGGELANERAKVRLLNRNRHHEFLGDYLAPSIEHKAEVLKRLKENPQENDCQPSISTDTPETESSTSRESAKRSRKSSSRGKSRKVNPKKPTILNYQCQLSTSKDVVTTKPTPPVEQDSSQNVKSRKVNSKKSTILNYDCQPSTSKDVETTKPTPPVEQDSSQNVKILNFDCQPSTSTRETPTPERSSNVDTAQLPLTPASNSRKGKCPKFYKGSQGKALQNGSPTISAHSTPKTGKTLSVVVQHENRPRGTPQVLTPGDSGFSGSSADEDNGRGGTEGISPVQYECQPSTSWDTSSSYSIVPCKKRKLFE